MSPKKRVEKGVISAFREPLTQKTSIVCISMPFAVNLSPFGISTSFSNIFAMQSSPSALFFSRFFPCLLVLWLCGLIFGPL